MFEHRQRLWRGLVTRQRDSVVACQRLQVADGLVQDSDECAWGVKFVAPNHLVAGGYQNVNANTHMALASSETAVDPGAEPDDLQLFLPLVMRQL
jgi:hypothetical protein